jgi:hypothetical protein
MLALNVLALLTKSTGMKHYSVPLGFLPLPHRVRGTAARDRARARTQGVGRRGYLYVLVLIVPRMHGKVGKMLIISNGETISFYTTTPTNHWPPSSAPCCYKTCPNLGLLRGSDGFLVDADVQTAKHRLTKDPEYKKHLYGKRLAFDSRARASLYQVIFLTNRQELRTTRSSATSTRRGSTGRCLLCRRVSARWSGSGGQMTAMINDCEVQEGGGW